MGRTKSIIKQRSHLLTTREASQMIGISEKEVIELSGNNKIPHYQVAGEFLRFKREEILKIRDDIRQEFNLGPTKISVFDRVKEILYFNDFYIISGTIIATLIWFILKD
jgi:excisionase family DNA binding protein